MKTFTCIRGVRRLVQFERERNVDFHHFHLWYPLLDRKNSITAKHKFFSVQPKYRHIPTGKMTIKCIENETYK